MSNMSTSPIAVLSDIHFTKKINRTWLENNYFTDQLSRLLDVYDFCEELGVEGCVVGHKKVVATKVRKGVKKIFNLWFSDKHVIGDSVDLGGCFGHRDLRIDQGGKNSVHFPVDEAHGPEFYDAVHSRQESCGL